jgi:serine/threonine protein kinase
LHCTRHGAAGVESLTLKVTREMHRGNLEVLKASDHEAAVLRQLEHPLVPRVRGYAQHNGLAYLLYDYIEGTSLDWLIAERSGRIEAAFVAAFRRDLSDILGYLARIPLVHGEISAKKIIVTPLDAFHLIDFASAFDPSASVWVDRGRKLVSKSEDLTTIDARAVDSLADALQGYRAPRR